MINTNKILLVDDDDTSNMITSVVIKKNINDVNVEVSVNGKEAIDHLSKRNYDFPQLIFLDINMPLINGFEFLEWYQANCPQQNSYVTILSTSSRQTDRDKAMSFDRVIDFIEKPLSKDKLSTLLTKVDQKMNTKTGKNPNRK